MRHLIVTAILAAASTPALAGDWSLGFDVDSRGGVRVGLGYRSRRHQRSGRVELRVRQACRKRWVEGYYEAVRREVTLPGYYKRVWEPAVYEWRRGRSGARYRVRLRSAGYVEVWVPARHEYRTEQVWYPGRWAYDCNYEGHRHRELYRRRVAKPAKHRAAVTGRTSRRSRRHA